MPVMEGERVTRLKSSFESTLKLAAMKDRHVDEVFGVENSLRVLQKHTVLHYKKRAKHSKSLPQK